MKIIQTLTFALLISSVAFACNNNPSSAGGLQLNNKKVNKSSIADISLSTSETAIDMIGDNTISQLEAAKKDRKAVFLVVTGTGIQETDKAIEVAKGASALYKNSVIVQMNRDDASNEKLVSEYRLSGAPLPLILVISSKGFPTGGYILAQATAENLAALVPSPKLEEVYTAIGESKPVIAVFTKKSNSDRSEVLMVCKETLKILNNNAVIVEVDMDDSRETSFLNQLRIDKASKTSTTLVINTQGQVSGTSTTVPDATKLASAATAPVKGGCGPGCGPAGCGK